MTGWRARRWGALRLAVALAACVIGIAPPLSAETSAVPIGLQAELTAKLAAHDKNMASRAGALLRIAIVTKPGNADGASAAAHLESAFQSIGPIAGLPHQQDVVPFTDAAALAGFVKTESIAIVYLTQGFEKELEAIAAALDGVSVMTCATVPDYVPRGGAVVGFDLVSGKSKILVNLPQAMKQNVRLDSNVLMIATVFK